MVVTSSSSIFSSTTISPHLSCSPTIGRVSGTKEASFWVDVKMGSFWVDVNTGPGAQLLAGNTWMGLYNCLATPGS